MPHGSWPCLPMFWPGMGTAGSGEPRFTVPWFRGLSSYGSHTTMPRPWPGKAIARSLSWAVPHEPWTIIEQIMIGCISHLVFSRSPPLGLTVACRNYFSTHQNVACFRGSVKFFNAYEIVVHRCVIKIFVNMNGHKNTTVLTTKTENKPKDGNWRRGGSRYVEGSKGLP